ncbi:MAG: beta-ketoacyl-ACP synthase II [Rickettsiales bacterium]|jgi:3-oxoacyl-[acyl-carrier-protein] synthase II|nr:beta-ketoacyl-ACP synthase II [Rickettsiales bacterium]
MGRRVVVTGVGMVTPLGVGCQRTWRNLINSKSGIGVISRFDSSGLPEGVSRVAGEVKFGEAALGLFDPEEFFPEKKDVRKTDRFMWYGMGAAAEAIADSDWRPENEEDMERTGVVVGSGIGGLESIQNTGIIVFEKGVKRISPFFVPESLINLVAGHISIRYLFKGPNLALSTACSTGTHALGEAMEIIVRDDADVMVAGGTEAPVCVLGVGGFSNMRALSTRFNSEPERASRPWDRDRDGFVVSEGAGIVVLEEYEHAKKRGANIYCEVIGYGLGGDAYHITAPDAEAGGAKRSMRMALRKARLNPEEIDYVNAHSTSTPIGDRLEFEAVREVFRGHENRLLMSSTKSAIGHMLGAAGSVEAIFLVLAIRDGIVPPTLNLDNVDDDCRGIDLVPHEARRRDIRIAMSNSFGFGGTNASIIMKKI